MTRFSIYVIVASLLGLPLKARAAEEPLPSDRDFVYTEPGARVFWHEKGAGLVVRIYNRPLSENAWIKVMREVELVARHGGPQVLEQIMYHEGRLGLVMPFVTGKQVMLGKPMTKSQWRGIAMLVLGLARGGIYNPELRARGTTLIHPGNFILHLSRSQATALWRIREIDFWQRGIDFGVREVELPPFQMGMNKERVNLMADWDPAHIPDWNTNGPPWPKESRWFPEVASVISGYHQKALTEPEMQALMNWSRSLPPNENYALMQQLLSKAHKMKVPSNAVETLLPLLKGPGSKLP